MVYAGLTPAFGGRRRGRRMSAKMMAKMASPMMKGEGRRRRGKKGGFLAPLAVGVLSSIAPQIFDTIKGIFSGSGSRKGEGRRRAGKLRKGSPEAKAFMAKIRAKSHRGRGLYGGAILTPGPLL
jgi:hypothetical protein